MFAFFHIYQSHVTFDFQNSILGPSVKNVAWIFCGKIPMLKFTMNSNWHLSASRVQGVNQISMYSQTCVRGRLYTEATGSYWLLQFTPVLFFFLKLYNDPLYNGHPCGQLLPLPTTSWSSVQQPLWVTLVKVQSPVKLLYVHHQRCCCVSLHQYAQSSRKALVCSPTSGCCVSHTSTVWCIGLFCSRCMCVSSVHHKADRIIPVGLWIKSLKNILLVLWSQYVVYANVFRLLVVTLCPKHRSKRKALTLNHRLKWQNLANKGIHLTLFIDTHHGCNTI